MSKNFNLGDTVEIIDWSYMPTVTKKEISTLKVGHFYQVFMNFAGTITCDICKVVVCKKGLGWEHQNKGIILVSEADIWEEMYSPPVIGKFYKPYDGSWCQDVNTGQDYDFNRNQTFKIVSEPYIYTFQTRFGQKLTRDFINLVSDTGIIFRVLHLGKFVEEPIVEEVKAEFTFAEKWPKEGSAIMLYNKFAEVCGRSDVWDYMKFSIFNGLPRVSDVNGKYQSVDSSDIWKYI